MNTPKFLMAAGMTLVLAACGGGSGTTTNPDDDNNIDPPDTTNTGNGTFPNGIWAATGTRDVLFENPPQLGDPYAGGMLITNTTLDIYEALQDDGAINGEAPCYKPSTGFQWSNWPISISGAAGVAFMFDGSFETGMERTTLENGSDQDKIYYTYVGPVTTEATTAFHEKYSISCTNSDI